jgi:hypothetical protein
LLLNEVVRSTSIENIVLLLQKSSIKEITIRVVQQPRALAEQTRTIGASSLQTRTIGGIGLCFA